MKGVLRLNRAKIVGLFLAVPLSGLLLTSCGASAGKNAASACALVNKSIHLYESSVQATGTTGTRLQGQALELLRQALPFAAIAAGANGQYQALQITLSESSRVPERLLLVALKAQCAPGANQLKEFVPPSSTLP